MIELPEGIVITISQGMLKEKGYKNWLKNFLYAMDLYDDGWLYYMRQGAVPKKDILYIYLCIGGKVRFRCNYIGSDTGHKIFHGGKEMTAKVWLMMCGPVVRAPKNKTYPMKGFRGFRYTEKIF